MKSLKKIAKHSKQKIKRGMFFALATLVFFFMGETYAAKTSEPKPKTVRSEPLKSQGSTMQQEQNKSKISKDAVKMFVKQVQIYGTVAKPQAIFFIKSTDPKVDGLKINRHFFDHIFRKVEKSSIKRVRKKQAKNKDHIEW